MTKRFLAVGIDDYTGIDPTGGSNLGVCVNDAKSMAELLVDAFGFDESESTKLTNQQASSSAIRSVLRQTLARCEAGDVACFYYAGHGSRLAAAPEQHDCDHFYEAIIPASGSPITDRDLFQIADTLEPSQVNFTVILDCCNSGGMDQEADTPFRCRALRFEPADLRRMEEHLQTIVPCGILIPEDSTACTNNVRNASATDGHLDVEEDPDKVFVEQAKTTLVAGCKFSELSWENGRHGLLTNAFLEIVNASNFDIACGDLLDKLRRVVTKEFNTLIRPTLNRPMSQTPQLRGQRSRMDEGFLQGFITSE